MKVGICIPWRPTESREPLLPVVLEELERQLPDAKVYLADSGHEPFNRSASRNQAVDEAEMDGCDVVVITDADTVLLGALREVVEAAYADGRAHLAYTEYLGLAWKGSLQFIRTRDRFGCLTDFASEDSIGAFQVMTPETFRAVGGYDESFIGWGYEDTDFAIRAKFVRHSGSCVALWHERDEDHIVRADANRERFQAKHPDVN